MLKHCALLFTLAITGWVSASQDGLPDGSGELTTSFKDTTLRFFPQVNYTIRQRTFRPRNPKQNPALLTGTPNLLPIENSLPPSGGPEAQFDGKFPGISYTFFDPPDPNIAVSTTHVVQVVNSDIAFFTKAGVKQFQQSMDNTGFFQGVAQTSFVFDPKCIYDQGAKRFIVIALEQRDSPQNSGILLAISDDANPNGNWTKYRINTKATVGGASSWFDYPGLGYNKDGVVITGNYFTFGNNSFKGARSYAIQKAGLLSGDVVHFSWFDHASAFTIQPTRIFESVSARVFGVAIKNSATFTFFAWSNLAGTATVATKDVAIPSFSFFNSEAQSTGGATLDPVADRMMDAAYRSGYLVCAHTAKVSATDNRAMVRWYEFTMGSWPSSGTPTRRQSGNISLAAPNHLFMPAIARNGNGAISIVLTRSSNTRTADLYALSHKSTDPLNKFGPLSLIKASTGNPAGASNRWGDYFSIVNDPSAATRFWGCGQTMGPNGQWTTQFVTWMVP